MFLGHMGIARVGRFEHLETYPAYMRTATTSHMIAAFGLFQSNATFRTVLYTQLLLQFLGRLKTARRFVLILCTGLTIVRHTAERARNRQAL